MVSAGDRSSENISQMGSQAKAFGSSAPGKALVMTLVIVFLQHKC